MKDESKTENAEDLRPIACTDTAGKLFWSLMNDRLRVFWTKNKYITSQQKGALSDVSGCLEHNWTLVEALKNAKLTKNQIILVWLDLKNAYGSVRHNLIQFALEWYHVPEWFADLIFQYYDSLFAFVTTPEWNTDLFSFLVGVFQGCVISPTLFIGVFQILIDFVDKFKINPYKWHSSAKEDIPEEMSNSDSLSLSQQAYVDDHTLVSSDTVGAQYNLDLLQLILWWSACLVLKPVKCISLGLADKRWKRGNQNGNSFGPFNPDLHLINLNDHGNHALITFIGDTKHQNFKCLGRKIWPSISDSPALDEIFIEFEQNLEIVDAQFISGASKVWIYQFMILSMLVWPFLVYPFSVNQIIQFETLATKFIKSWYGLNHSANPKILYLPRNKYCGWGLTSAVSLFKSMQIVGQHILKYSRDILTRNVSFLHRAKCKRSNSKRWEPGEALDNYESILNFDIAFRGNTGKSGLGSYKNRSLKNASNKEKRSAITDLCKQTDTDARVLELHNLVLSGNLLKWDDLIATQTDWNTQIMGMSENELSFTLNAQALSLPSPSNLRRWGLHQLAACPLCAKPGASTKHILSGCTKSLFQHRYTWRHDNVLRCILKNLCGRISIANRNTTSRHKSVGHISTSFVKSGSVRKSNNKPEKRCSNLLSETDDWKLTVDFDASIPFPITDVPTTLRPDIVIYSLKRRIVIWGELTVPNEERIKQSAIKKIARYKNLADALELKEWTVHNMSFEVGSIGFLGQSVKQFLSKLGFTGPELKFMLIKIAQAARRSSFYIWNARHSPIWSPPSLFEWTPSVAFPRSLNPFVVPTPQYHPVNLSSPFQPDIPSPVTAPQSHQITSSAESLSPPPLYIPPKPRRNAAIRPPPSLYSHPTKVNSPVQTRQVTKQIPTIPEDSTFDDTLAPSPFPNPVPNPSPKKPSNPSPTNKWCDPWKLSTGIGSDILNFEVTPRPDQSSSVHDGAESSPIRVVNTASLRKNDICLAAIPEVQEKHTPFIVNPISEEKYVTPVPSAFHYSPPQHVLQVNFEHGLQLEQTTHYEHSFTRPKTFLRRSSWNL